MTDQTKLNDATPLTKDVLYKAWCAFHDCTGSPLDSIEAAIKCALADLQSSQSQVSDELSTVIKFLLGEGALDGLHFGDSDTARPRPRYWWRKELRKRWNALQSQAKQTDGSEG